MNQSASLPVPYIARSHAYYAAQGFDKPYRYAHHQQTPFTRLPKPLGECVLGLVTTASTYQRVPLEPRKVDSAPIDPGPQQLFADDLSWDKQATHLDDLASYYPVAALQTLASQGRLGGLTPQFYCAPTEYSHRSTYEHDAPEIYRRLAADGADIALLVPL